METTRRGFLQSSLQSTMAASLLGALGACASSSSKPRASKEPPKSVLILGGTGFLGPAIVEDAQKRGYTLTLFNRGKREKTKGTSFDVEKLYGNRDPNKTADEKSGDADADSPKGLSQIEALVKAGRKWDMVIDTSGYYPRMVKASAELLAPATGLYVFISTVSVYAKNTIPGEDESAELATIKDPAVETMGAQFENYGPLKAVCEKVVEEALPGRALVVRPGYIVGVRDDTDRFTYWPVRMSEGGEMIIPGQASDPVQYIDVRDLAKFILTCAAKKTTGTFNATSPMMPWQDVVRSCEKACRAVGKEPAKQVWVPNEWLAAHGIEEGALPIYIPPRGEYAGFHQRSVAKAVAAGLTIRPCDKTCTEILQWWPGEIERRVRVTKEMKDEAQRGGKPIPQVADPTQLRAGPPTEKLASVLNDWRTEHPA